MEKKQYDNGFWRLVAEKYDKKYKLEHQKIIALNGLQEDLQRLIAEVDSDFGKAVQQQVDEEENSDYEALKLIEEEPSRYGAPFKLTVTMVALILTVFLVWQLMVNAEFRVWIGAMLPLIVIVVCIAGAIYFLLKGD